MMITCKLELKSKKLLQHFMEYDSQKNICYLCNPQLKVLASFLGARAPLGIVCEKKYKKEKVSKSNDLLSPAFTCILVWESLR